MAKSSLKLLISGPKLHKQTGKGVQVKNPLTLIETVYNKSIYVQKNSKLIFKKTSINTFQS